MRNKYSDDHILEVTGGTNSVVIRDNLQVADTLTTDKLAVTSSIEGDVTHNGNLTSDAVITAQLTASDAAIDNLTVETVSVEDKKFCKSIPLSDFYYCAEASIDGSGTPAVIYEIDAGNRQYVSIQTVNAGNPTNLDFYIDIDPYIPAAGRLLSLNLVTVIEGGTVTFGGAIQSTTDVSAFGAGFAFDDVDVVSTPDPQLVTISMADPSSAAPLRSPTSQSLPLDSNRILVETSNASDDYVLRVYKVWIECSFYDSLFDVINIKDS